MICDLLFTFTDAVQMRIPANLGKSSKCANLNTLDYAILNTLKQDSGNTTAKFNGQEIV
jgi:hypothetical protein